MRKLCKNLVFKRRISALALAAGLLLGACGDLTEKEEYGTASEGREQSISQEDVQIVSGETQMGDENQIAVELTPDGEPIDPDSYSQAIHYEGYLDESPYTEWNQNWNACDFDEDEKRDRIYREVTDTEIAYRIDFGDGDVLELARSEDFFMGIKVYSADICGFYGNEILFVGQHHGSTDPSDASDIYLYRSTYGGYERILLPGQEDEEDCTAGYETILSDRGDECVKLECAAAEYEEIYAWDIWTGSDFTTEEFFEISAEPLVKTTAYDAAFIEYAGETKLALYQNVTGKWVLKDFSFILDVSRWENLEGRYEFSITELALGKLEGKSIDDFLEEYSYVLFSKETEYIPMYINVIKTCLEEYEDNELSYNLIYLDEDEVPELALGMEGYWVSLYTYQDGAVYELMDQWPYGAGGNHGYEYIPHENVIRNYNTDYAGLVLYESYYMMDENYELNDGFWLMQSYEDEEGNVLMEESDEDYDANNWHFYYEEQEISAEEYDSYCIDGEYEVIDTTMSAPELIKELYAPLFY